MLVASANAVAVTKCTGADGRVVYQEMPCAASQESRSIAVAPSQEALDKRWRFVRQKDPMTGLATCFAISPTAHSWRSVAGAYTRVFAQVAMTPATADLQFSVQISNEPKTSFHIKVDGLGLRVDDKPFIPLSRKLGSSALSVERDRQPELLGSIRDAKVLRLRLRYWPYEQAHDAEDIPMAGAFEVVRRAMSCEE